MSYNQVVGAQSPNVWIRGEVAATNSGVSNYAITYGAGVTFGGEGAVDKGMTYAADGSTAITFPFSNPDAPNFTVSGWWKPVDGANSEFFRMAYSQDATAYSSVVVDANGLVSFRGGDGSLHNVATIKLNTWSHIAVKPDPADPFGGVFFVFLNGVKYSVTDVDNYGFDGIFSLGRSTGTGNAALYDEMAFWNKTLTDTEITAQYNSSYAAVILSQSPADYLPYGTNKNAAVNGVDWTAGTTQTSSPSGIFGRAIAGNNGTDDSIKKTRTGGVTTQTFWIKTTTANTFIMQYRNSTASTSWALYLAGGKVQYGSTLTGTRATSTTLVNDGNWHHVALNINQVNDTNRLKIYVDGVQEYTGNLATITSTTLTLDIVSRSIIATNTGATVAAAPNFTGLLDEVAFFDRALSAQEIADQYAARPQVYTPPVAVNVKVTAPVGVSNINGTDGNNAYQVTDTTSISGYRTMILAQRATSFYNDGLSVSNLGAVGGNWIPTGNVAFQQPGKFTGGVKLVGQSSAISSLGVTSTGSVPTSVSFWFRAIGLNASRVVYSELNSSSAAIYTIQINPDNTITVPGTAYTSTIVNDEKWHHIVIASDANSRLYDFYFDGVYKGATSFSSGNTSASMRFETPANTTTYFDEMSIIDNGLTNSRYTSANVQQQYNYKEFRDKAIAGTFGFFGTTSNVVRGVQGARIVATAPTIGFNGTSNTTARVPQRLVVPVGNATFNANNAIISSTRNYRFPIIVGSVTLTGTNGNRAYTPIANNKAEPAYATFTSAPANVYSPQSQRVVAPATSMTLSGVAGVAKTRTDRTVSTNAATTLVRAQGAKLKVNGEYVDNFNNNNRWYKQIRATYLAKQPGVTVPLTDADYAWYKFEGTTPPFVPAVGANGASTGDVTVVGNYELGIDAGHNRHGIKFTNGGYFKSRVTYPFLIPGAQLPLLGGLRSHYTAEFAFRTITPGPICSGVRINAGGKLEFLQTNGYWYELRTDYPNLLDGQWHHMVFISPQQFFVPPESNPDRNFVLVDGKVVSAVHAPVYVPSTWGYDARTGPYGYDSGTGTTNPSIEFDDILIAPFRIISVAEAAKLYYEYSEATIVNGGSPALIGFNGTTANRGKGNVFRVLAFYGSPEETNAVTLEQPGKYENSYSFFSIPAVGQQSLSGYLNDGGRGQTFRHNGMLVFPVSYTATNASAVGLLDPNRATYVDDKTGYTRLIDLDNDFSVDPADFDMVTFVRWPQMNDSIVTRKFLNSSGLSSGTSNVNTAENNDIMLARKNNIEKFSLQILKLANKGVHIWVQDPQTALGLGLIQSYVDSQDTMSEKSEEMSATGVPGIKNLGARATEIKYGKQPAEGTFGSPGYFDVGHNIWKRRITAKVENLTDIPTWNEVDKVYWVDSNPFKTHAQMARRKYKFFPNGYNIGDEVGLDFNTIYYTRYTSADPVGVIGTVVSREQAVVSTKAGTFVENPYRDRVLTLAVDAGTTIKGIKINSRIFAEMSGGFTQPYILPGNNKYYYNGSPTPQKNSDWDYDSERENQIVAYYAVEKFRNDLYLGSESQPYVVYGDSVPLDSYAVNDMHTRGINWIKAYNKPSVGSVKVTATAATIGIVGNNNNVRNVRNTKVTTTVARTRFEFTMPKNYTSTNARVSSFPGIVGFKGVDIQAIIKVQTGIIVFNGSDNRTTGVGEDLVLYYSNWAPSLYKEDI